MSYAAVAMFLIVCAIVGAVAGALVGCAISFSLKLGMRGVWKDTLLGALGFLFGFVASAVLPWPRNTVVYHVDGTHVTSTMSGLQHPYVIAFTLAILLPVANELYRSSRSKALARSSRG